MVAITERYRRRVEKRSRNRRSVLLPMRVSCGGATLFEGATLDVSTDGVYFRMPGGRLLAVGTKVTVELSVPAELSGAPFGYRTMRDATVVRIESDTLAHRVGCRPRDCGIALALDPEVVTQQAARRSPAVAAVA